MCGLRNKVIQRKLLAEDNLTMKKAFEIAARIELVSLQASELQSTLRNGHLFFQQVRNLSKQKPSSVPTKKVFQRHILLRNIFYHYKNCGLHCKKSCISTTCMSEEQGARKGPPRNPFQSTKHLEGEQSFEEYYESDLPMQIIFSMIENPVTGRIVVTPIMNVIPLKIELDTSASVSVVLDETYQK